jgi:hypothetical protein
MHSFKDTEGRAWTVRVDVAGVKRVRALAGVDLMEAATRGAEALGELLADPVKVCDTLYALCLPEAERRGVTDEDFGRALCGDEIEAAAHALAAGLVDFFPARSREPLRKYLAAVRGLQDRLSAEAAKEMAALDPAQVADEMIARLRAGAPTSGAPSGGSPGPPASTPTP